jgi:hypothetical protein
MPLEIADVELNMRLIARERKTGIGVGAGTSAYDHLWSYVARFQGGLGSNRVGAAYSGRHTIVNGTPLDLDLRSSLTSVLDGSVVSFPIVMGIFVSNLSTTSGQTIRIGAGGNPFISWLIATGDGLLVGPSGFKALWSPIDGYATTAATADILRLVSDVGTVSADVAILGRAS